MFRLAHVGLLLTALAGCAAPTSMPEDFAPSAQKKVRAAQHWNVIARDVALETRKILEERNLGQHVVDIPRRAAATPFEHAFHDFLTSALLSRGQRLVEHGRGTLSLGYATQVVRHESGRGWMVPGPFTVLAAGVLVGRNALDNWSSHNQGAGLLALGAGVDALTGGHLSDMERTRTELIVTTTLFQGGEILMRKSDVYYLADEDDALYLPPAPARSEWDW